ncbi:MAG: hypothetical protein WC933_02770 [Candidatus Paceibacterota bacterium]|jgi:hypothetical protein
MYTIRRTKLYKSDQIDVRSYERQDAIAHNQDLLIILEEDGVEKGRMVLTLDQLKDESLILNRQRVASKRYLGQWYDLLSYKWKKTPLTKAEKKKKKTQEAWEKANKLEKENPKEFYNKYL